MMPYLNLRCDYFDHPKTKRLIGLLGRGAEILPIRLWSYCGMFHAKDGKLTGYAEQEIEKLAGWWGKEGALLPALEQIKFMQRDRAGNWAMTDWREHQGHIEALKVRARKGAAARWRKYRSNAASNAQAVHKQCSIPPSVLPVKGGERERQRAGRFPVPQFEPLPVPLFARSAEAMLAACQEQIQDITKIAKRTPIMATTQEGTVHVAREQLEPEAVAAIDLWRARKAEIKRALAG